MDNSHSLISVIIPTFNRAYCIANAIESVINQSSKNWELIIIDDGSCDTTSEIVGFFLYDKRITYYFQDNSGVSTARNFGAGYAKGEYLIFLDSDDYFQPDLIKILEVENLQDYDLICWQVLKNIDGKKKLWKPVKLDNLYNNITATFLAGSICYKKSIFFRAGKFDPKMKFGENYELGMRVGKISGLRIKLINEPLLNYNVPNERESNSINNRLNSYLHLYNKHSESFIQDNIANSRMNYFLGFIYEKKGHYMKARGYYKNAYKYSKRNYKALLKIIFLTIFRK